MMKYTFTILHVFNNAISILLAATSFKEYIFVNDILCILYIHNSS